MQPACNLSCKQHTTSQVVSTELGYMRQFEANVVYSACKSAFILGHIIENYNLSNNEFNVDCCYYY
jgi:hypothetical protein